ncbi:hypothetical protein GWI33_001133 [Rhynchophorus ferrugineus]|uniref:Uncharacterized protein n=1 Tax=Rhynchophorus ferrugineus TaxID=354439 RepID=A0A834M1T2_RHYFE|nr:hypothetical protein GWI33_001133 [Rhynchophorus ferrugineus]
MHVEKQSANNVLSRFIAWQQGGRIQTKQCAKLAVKSRGRSGRRTIPVLRADTALDGPAELRKAKDER